MEAPTTEALMEAPLLLAPCGVAMPAVPARPVGPVASGLVVGLPIGGMPQTEHPRTYLVVRPAAAAAASAAAAAAEAEEAAEAAEAEAEASEGGKSTIDGMINLVEAIPAETLLFGLGHDRPGDEPSELSIDEMIDLMEAEAEIAAKHHQASPSSDGRSTPGWRALSLL